MPKKNSIKPRKKRRRCIAFLAFVLAIITAIAAHQAPPHQLAATGKNSLRSVWITNIGTGFLHHTTRLDETLHQLATLNFNTIYPAVWNRAHTLYPSSIAPRDPLITLPFTDILQSATKQAHRQGLSIVPWFEYGLMAPASSSLVKDRPDWVTQTSNGRKILKPHSQDFLAKLPAPLANLIAELTGANLVWLNPMHPEVQQFLTDLILEVVNNYDIDGIQLDDHFGLPVKLGYDPYTVKLYQKEHNGASPPQNPSNPHWMRWRAQKLTDLMSKISKAVKAAKPNCLISLSPNPASFAYRSYLQDWPTWARKSLIDEVILQVYRQTSDEVEAVLRQRELQQIKTFIPVSIGLYTGPIKSPRPVKTVAEQVKTVQKWGYNGVSFFCWESTLGIFKQNSKQTVEATFRQLFH